jgi:hypothetical protein
MDDFDKALQDIIEERVSVLFEIERAVFTERYGLSLRHREVFSIQSISMIYSLWEGFVQKSFNLYIDELNKAQRNLDKYCDEIVIYHMENSFKQFKEYPAKASRKARFFASLREFHLDSTCTISRVVDTESNVGLDVLNKLLQRFALEQFPDHWANYAHPNPNLKDSLKLFLRLRNEVAHGCDLTSNIDQSLYDRFKKMIIDLMWEVRAKMIIGLKDSTFLAPGQRSQSDSH